MYIRTRRLTMLFAGVLSAILVFSCAYGNRFHEFHRFRPLQSNFRILDGKIGDLDTISINNTETGESVVIVTSFGGRVEELHLASQTTGALRDVLLTHHGDSDAIKENMWWKGMLLMPYANRIAYGRYKFFNGSYQLPLNDSPRSNSLHGFMPGKQLRVLSRVTDDTSGTLTTSTQMIAEPGYPFQLDIIIEYKLEEGKGFSIAVTATNSNGDGTPLPFYLGWHPYFKCTPHSTVVKFDPCHSWAHVSLNANMDPTGITIKHNPFDGTKPIGGTTGSPTFYDDEFKSLKSGSMCSSPVETIINDVESKQSVVIWQDFTTHIVHVFTGYTDEPSVAVEPMSAMADAFNNHDGLSTLSDGESWKGSFGVYVK